MNDQVNEILEASKRALQRGETDAAVAGFETSLQAAPNNIEALYYLAAALYQDNRNETALARIEQAVALAPHSEDCHNLYGLVLIALGQIDGAISALTRATECNNNFPDAHNNLGAAHEASGSLDAAEACYRAAVQTDPNYAQGHNNLARVLLATGRPKEAEAACRAALAAQTDLYDAQVNLAVALQRQGAIDEAETAVENTLASSPKNANLLRYLGALRHSRGDLSGSETALRQAISLEPQLAKAFGNLAGVLLDQDRAEEAETCFKQVLALDPSDEKAHSNFLLCQNYTETEPAKLFDRHKEWASHHKNGLSHAPTGAPERNARIRIGYVSGDFRRHSVANFFEPLLKHRDGARFETYCYANLENPDSVTEHLKSLSDHWRWVAGLDDSNLLKTIRDDRIDILIDLSGHTAGNRLPVFQQKAAPVQATWLGYPNTTGLKEIAFRITDSIVDPPGAETFWTERLVRLEGGFLCYSPPPDSPPVATPPCLASGIVTFGSFNNMRKVTPDVLSVWARILNRIPNARLILKARTLADPANAERLRAAFGALGIAAHRLELRGPVDEIKDHLAAYADIDIALDPFPYNGTTTSCEALWMGVPVITYKGNRHAERVGSSILTRIGLSDWVADNVENYVETAIQKADDLEGLARIRGALRNQMLHSELCDDIGFAHRMETAFEQMIQQRAKEG